MKVNVTIKQKAQNMFIIILKVGGRAIRQVKANTRQDAESFRKDLLDYAVKTGLDVNRY